MTQSTYNTFSEKKNSTLDLLVKLRDLLNDGGQYGLDLPEHYKQKLDKVIQGIDEEKLKVVLVGGFSEGKTSIAAAWLDKIDPNSMNISAQESSNEVKIYNIDDKYQLVDTPGLFGYKEKYDDQSNETQKYKDITKHYVSEAHVVLYVMNGKNSIKESNTQDILWLFKDLNLLARTVFILGRFDEVANVEDEDEYIEKLSIKRTNVTERLKDILSLSSEEINNLKIVGISANPFDEGIEYWLKNKEEFKKLSHIETLQKATVDIVQERGGYENLLEEMKSSIFRDLIEHELPLIREKYKSLEINNTLSSENLEKISSELSSTKTNIDRTRNELLDFVKRYFSDLVDQVNSSTMETIGSFFNREIGLEGYVLSTTLQNKIESSIDGINFNLDNQLKSLDLAIENQSAIASLVSDQTINLFKVASKSSISSQTVIATRDGIVAVGKFFGANLKSTLSFRPWGAVNLAGNINKALPFLGIAIEVWDSYSKAKKEDEFKQSKNDLAKDLVNKSIEIQKELTREEFIKNFPKIQELTDKQEQFSEILEVINTEKNGFEIWNNSILSLESEFRRLSSK